MTPLLLLWLAAADPAELSARAQQAASERRMDEAERLWREALAADPKYYPAVFNLGLLLFNLKRDADAEPLLRQAASLHAAEFNPPYLLGAACARQSKTDEAIRAWRAAQKLRPDHVRLLELLAVEYGKARYFQEAEAAARRGLALAPSDSNLYFLAIKAAQDSGDLEGGAKVAAEAVRRFPNLARAQFENGFYLQKRGDLGGAAAAMKKAMELDPAYEEPYFFLGDLLAKQDRFEEAMELLRKALAIRADYIPARVLLARSLMNLDRLDEARRELSAAIEQNPRHPQPHLLLSQIYFRQGDEIKAKQEKDLSLRLRRENPAALEAVQGRNYPESN